MQGKTEQRPAVQEIVNIEWNMFSQVNNQGGKATCQNRPDTFAIMRRSQLSAWSDEILESYRIDLKRAELLKRNLCAEKYGYMLEFMSPPDYEKICGQLPAVSAEKLKKIEEIVAVNLEWEREVDKKYPKIRFRGRHLTKDQDTPYTSSLETYMTGELKTYSEKTVSLLHNYTILCREEGRNLAMEILQNTVSEYGYESISKAERQL